MKEIETHSLRTSKVKPFTNIYITGKEQITPLEKNDWIQFKKKAQQLFLLYYKLEN